MHPLLRCLIYVVLIGIAANPVAYFLPRKWFHPQKFPFRAFGWERGGLIYEKIGVRRWKDKVIDQSRITAFLMKKTVQPHMTAAQMDRLAVETCVSEAVHVCLAGLSLYCLRLWPGAGGAVFTLLFILFGQLNYAVIQRYNRPRFMDIARRMRLREEKKRKTVAV